VKHWIKNFFVFLPLIFSDMLFNKETILASVIVFILFSFCASVIYVVNDICDIAKDQRHPVKRNRALASGKISQQQAFTIAGVLLVAAIVISFYVSPMARLVVLAYFLMNIAYSTILKHEVLIDVFIIAIGFVMRVVAGALGVAVAWSSLTWLLLVTFFIALFLALGKRRHELLYTDNSAGEDHRPVLEKYNEKLLDYLIVMSATLTIISYSMYVMYLQQFIFTFPFVIYGMFRYMHVVYTEDSGGDPTETVSKDKILIANVGAWSLIVTSTLMFAH
jgi:4-hydroxybenzoate polyprenyltransferase